MDESSRMILKSILYIWFQVSLRYQVNDNRSLLPSPLDLNDKSTFLVINLNSD